MKNATAFVCILEYAPFEPERYAELYTPLRRVGLERITSPALRVQSAAAELAYLAAARAALEGGLFGSPNPENNKSLSADGLKKRFVYSYSKNGRPVIDGAFMSLSHTDGAALAAVSDVPVGVDAERMRRVDERVAKRMLAEAEKRKLSELKESEKNGYLLECWTAKESFLKLTGEGIAFGMNRLLYNGESSGIRCTQTGETAVLRRLNGEQGAPEREKLIACVCTAEPCKTELLRFSSAKSAADFVLGKLK